ncbi:DUF6265 family protein [Sphingomicrobium clamense]|uniref:DUF6265 domain-containing protein n=1 Tax=Sphingomicrobium clamense TaxID=2851013 RepID=A0ABS6V4E9_9SPHN|nr:DUF6265 family protein [Sphingomicrobium sp. B8]MBW0144436.1 hypothetical protein [Sphingomicrobium sp. B8]
MMPNLLAIIALACAEPAVAEHPVADTAQVAEPIDAAKFLVGDWVGEGMGGHVTETWSAPHGGQMVGHFMYAREGKPVFYEIMLIRPNEAGYLEFLVKHFNADFTAWEEKDEWVTFEGLAERREDRALRFNGLSLVLDENDVLTATVTMRRGDGTVNDVPFVMKRVD